MFKPLGGEWRAAAAPVRRAVSASEWRRRIGDKENTENVLPWRPKPFCPWPRSATQSRDKRRSSCPPCGANLDEDVSRPFHQVTPSARGSEAILSERTIPPDSASVAHPVDVAWTPCSVDRDPRSNFLDASQRPSLNHHARSVPTRSNERLHCAMTNVQDARSCVPNPRAPRHFSPAYGRLASAEELPFIGQSHSPTNAGTAGEHATKRKTLRRPIQRLQTIWSLAPVRGKGGSADPAREPNAVGS